MGSNLYEFGFQLHWSDLLKILPFILPIVIWFFSCTFDNKKWLRLVLKAVSIGFTVFIVWSLFIDPLIQYRKICVAIENGETSVVEGEVCNFESPSSSLGGHATESFSIGDVRFSYSGTENYGYCRLLCNGGVVEENGQKLKIVYYTDPKTKINTICSIDEAS
ncbi:MAG: hypothetical protein ACI3XS_01065 [Eubacteriales bacterium]